MPVPGVTMRRGMVQEQASFGALLRQYRLRRGLTQQDLAARAGLSGRGVSDLERGARRNPYPHTLARLAGALGLSVAERSALGRTARRNQREGEPAVERAETPVPLTSFVGREQELRELECQLEGTRLLILTGVGGIGKTRLALSLSESVRQRFNESVAFVNLAHVTHAARVPQAVASALGVREQPPRALVDTVVDVLQPRRLLLILDNCEHLLGSCAEFSYAVLRACPRVRILATSREPLGVPGETVWQVPPIEVNAAQRLFLERAQAAAPDFSVPEQQVHVLMGICQRLDCLPLAIELAAARVRSLSIEVISQRLDERFRLLVGGSTLVPSRQQTLLATLDWSYSLLSASEKLLFDRLSVFSSGWTLDAAEVICSDDTLSSDTVLDTLSRLVDKSLVEVERRDGQVVRYRLLDTIQRYGWQHLESRTDSTAVGERHASFFLEFAERSVPRPVITDLRFEEVEREHDNLLSALHWLIERGETQQTLRLGAALGPFWFFQSYFDEGRAWLNQLLRLPTGAVPTPDHAEVTYRAGHLAWCQGDLVAAGPLLEASAGEWRQLGDGGQLAQPLSVLGHLARSQGDLVRARSFYSDAIALATAGRNPRAEANALFGLAQTAVDLGDLLGARAAADTAVALAQRHGWMTFMVGLLQIRGLAEEQDGNTSTARRFLEEGLARAKELGPRGTWWVLLVLPYLARVVSKQGDLRGAHALAQETLALARDVGDRQGLTRGLEVCASLAAAHGRHELALRFAGAAAGIRTSIGAPLSAPEVAELEHSLAKSRYALGGAEADAAWSIGHGWTVELALREALATDLAIPPGVAPAPNRPGGLTARELEVVTLVADGLTNRQISETLVISEPTVVRHMSNVLGKLGLASRSQVAVWAVQHDVVVRVHS